MYSSFYSKDDSGKTETGFGTISPKQMVGIENNTYKFQDSWGKNRPVLRIDKYRRPFNEVESSRKSTRSNDCDFMDCGISDTEFISDVAYSLSI